MEYEQRKTKLKDKYGNLYLWINEILFKHDLMKINFEYNIDEYEPEVDTIIQRLTKTDSVEDIALIIYEEFEIWFNKECILPKEIKAYLNIAEEILNYYKLENIIYNFIKGYYTNILFLNFILLDLLIFILFSSKLRSLHRRHFNERFIIYSIFL